MKEWTLKQEKLPEGIEEVSVLMASGKDAESSYQWIVDPAAGPPQEGTAKSPQEAFMAIRRELTTHNAGFGAEFGGLPMQLPGGPPLGNPGPMAQRQKERTGVKLKAVQAIRKAVAEAEAEAPRARTSKRRTRVPAKLADVADDAVSVALNAVAKGLVDADIFVETATGEDLRGILPDEVLEELSSKLSAVEHRGNQEDKSDG
jgi:hypothetical protein